MLSETSATEVPLGRHRIAHSDMAILNAGMKAIPEAVNGLAVEIRGSIWGVNCRQHLDNSFVKTMSLSVRKLVYKEAQEAELTPLYKVSAVLGPMMWLMSRMERHDRFALAGVLENGVMETRFSPYAGYVDIYTLSADHGLLGHRRLDEGCKDVSDRGFGGDPKKRFMSQRLR